MVYADLQIHTPQPSPLSETHTHTRSVQFRLFDLIGLLETWNNIEE